MGDPLFAKYGKKMKVGEVLFRAGEVGQEMFVIRAGAIRVFVVSNQVEKTLAVMGPGEFVGEMSILNNRPRTATAVVVEDADLLVVGVRVLEEMIVHNTEIALRLIRKLARRLESADALIEVLLHRDSKARVIENLKRIASLHASEPGEEVRIAADYNGMAEQVGLDLGEVQDVISRLIRASALVEEEGEWAIAEPDKLGEMLQFLRLKDQYR